MADRNTKWALIAVGDRIHCIRAPRLSPNAQLSSRLTLEALNLDEPPIAWPRLLLQSMVTPFTKTAYGRPCPPSPASASPQLLASQPVPPHPHANPSLSHGAEISRP